jgi:outer membrane protein assembly factor BamB
MSSSALFIGIKGTVLAIDRASGHEIWRSHLKGTDFVNVVLDKGELYATTKGEIFALDPASGAIRWRNPLQGLGWGLVSIANSQGNLSVIEEKRRADQAAATGAVVASTA